MAVVSPDTKLVCSTLDSKPQAMLRHSNIPPYSRLYMICLDDAIAELDLLISTWLGKNWPLERKPQYPKSFHIFQDGTSVWLQLCTWFRNKTKPKKTTTPTQPRQLTRHWRKWIFLKAKLIYQALTCSFPYSYATVNKKCRICLAPRKC